MAERLMLEAKDLREKFDQAFWNEEIGTYALALDGEKRPCRVVASNAGHALFAGIAAPDRAKRVAERLLTPDMFSGWGVRTLAMGQPRYNPMSYHNGSVWPHDNALIAMGFARYGLKVEAARVFSAIFDAGRHQDLSRLPELFCGFTRKAHRAPTPYPVACAPQVAYFGPGYLASLHLLAAQRAEASLERLYVELAHVPYGGTVPVTRGWVDLPDGPGLGADPEADLAAGRYAT